MRRVCYPDRPVLQQRISIISQNFQQHTDPFLPNLIVAICIRTQRHTGYRPACMEKRVLPDVVSRMHLPYYRQSCHEKPDIGGDSGTYNMAVIQSPGHVIRMVCSHLDYTGLFG